MSNLGLYQWMVQASKKVGGPAKFMGILIGVGFAGGTLVTKGSEAAARKIKTRKKTDRLYDTDKLYTVHELSWDDHGHMFNVGDKFRILEYDIPSDMLMVKVIGDSDNPYCVSADLMDEISDFKKNQRDDV